MAQYFTDYSEYTAGQQPSDWTERFVTANITWFAENSADSGVTGGKVLVMTRVTANGRSMIAWDAIDSDAERQDVEILFKSKKASGTPSVRGIGRASGAAGSENAYVGGYNGSLQEVSEYVSGTFTQGDTSTDFTPSDDTWYWTRFRLNGTSRLCRMWNDGDAEPGTWQASDTDSDITGDGWVGLFSFSQIGTGHIIDVFGVGTDGDSAPSQPLNVLTIDSTELVLESDGINFILNSGLTLDSAELVLESDGIGLSSINVHNDFPTGNIDVSRTVISEGSTSTPTITIFAEPGTNISPSTPADIYYGFAGRITGINGKTPTFVLAENDPVRAFSPAPASYRPWFTYDDPTDLDATWVRFANNTVGGGDITFDHNEAFNQDTVYVTSRPRFPTAKWRAYVDSIKADQYISEPASSDSADHVYFSTTSTTAVTGATLNSIDLLSFRLSDDAAQPDDGTAKINIVHITGQHAHEEQGEYALRAYIDFCLGADAKAVSLRKNTAQYFYGIVNSTGRDGGGYRGTLQSGSEDVDPNRIWDDTPPVLEEVDATKDAITEDTGNDITVFFDWHGRGTTSLEPAIFAHAGRIDDNFVSAVQSYLGNVVDIASGEDSGISTVHYRATTGVKLAATVEGDGLISVITEYDDFGEAVAQALDDLYTSGDLQSIASQELVLESPGITLTHNQASQLTLDSAELAIQSSGVTLTYSGDDPGSGDKFWSVIPKRLGRRK
jgi:hypothetical protein